MNIEKSEVCPIPLKDNDFQSKKDERWKGILFGLIQGILLVLNQAIGKTLFNRYPNSLEPEQLILFRCSVAFLSTLITVNKNIL